MHRKGVRQLAPQPAVQLALTDNAPSFAIVISRSLTRILGLFFKLFQLLFVRCNIELSGRPATG